MSIRFTKKDLAFVKGAAEEIWRPILEKAVLRAGKSKASAAKIAQEEITPETKELNWVIKNDRRLGLHSLYKMGWLL